MLAVTRFITSLLPMAATVLLFVSSCNSPATVPSSSAYHGIDISHYNGDAAAEIDGADSITFIICKATEGVTYTDPDFFKNMRLIGEKNAISGCYHFYHTDDDPIAQADFYWQQAGKTAPGMPPIVDVEEGSLPANPAGIDIARMQQHLLAFITRVQTVSGRPVMIYTNLAFADQYLNNPAFAQHSLWLAEYSSTPQLPLTWKNKGYKIWQKNASYDINSHPTDYDLYTGPREDLLK
jgi:lysozyme